MSARACLYPAAIVGSRIRRPAGAASLVIESSERRDGVLGLGLGLGLCPGLGIVRGGRRA